MTLPCSDAQAYSDSRGEKKKTNHYLSQISAHGISADQDLWIAHGKGEF